MKNVFAIAAAAALIATSSSASAAPDGKNRKVTVENLGSQTVRELHASTLGLSLLF
ncbi:MAG: hypothetical protein ACXW27_12380 [Allosphingosinicella sp.]